MRNVNLMLSLLTVTAFISGAPIRASAQVETAAVKLDGLSCAFCAYGLEKRLKKVEGVEKLEIQVDQGTANLTVKKGKALPIEAVEKAVKDGGFTPREVSLTVMGRLTERNGRAVLTVPDSEEIFLVEPKEQLLKIKEALKGADKAVRLTGKLSQERTEGHTGHPYALSIERFEIL